MSLSSWFPGATPLVVAGRVVLASELRVRDLATIEAYTAARLGAPLAGLDAAADDYPDRLRSLYDTLERWPPDVGSPETAAALFGDRRGLAFFLALTLRASGLSADELDAVALEAEPDEVQEVERVAWGVQADHKADLVRLIDDHLGLPAFRPRPTPMRGRPISWAQAVGDAVDGDPRRVEAVGDLTLSQWRMLRCGGETELRDDPLPEDAELCDRVQDARREFWGVMRTPVAVTPTPQPPDDDRDVGEWKPGDPLPR